MMAPPPPPPTRPPARLKPDRPFESQQRVRRAVVLLPNGLTLINLLCGIYAIILAIRGDFGAAPLFIVLGGIADAFDGRVARATGTGSQFGEELDSLVDAISFGFAPALIMYLELPSHGTWEWLLVFIFTSCAVMRLARFNVEQAGRKKSHFHGLPSPAAGLTLATYYWFSQTPLYNQTVILFTNSKTLSDLPWHTILRALMAILAALMISDVPYPAVPSIGIRSLRQILGSLVVTGCVVLLLVGHTEFIFPALLAYVLYGVIKWMILGFIGRAGTPDEIFLAGNRRHASLRVPGTRSAPTGPLHTVLAEDGDEPDHAPRHDQRYDERRPGEAGSSRRRRRRRGQRGNRPPGSLPPGPPLPDSPTGPSE